MRRYFRIIKGNFQSIISINKLCSICIIFIYLFCVKFTSLNRILSIGKLFELTFYGPNNLSDNISEVLFWSLYQFYIIYAIGDYCYRELQIRCVYTITRIGDKHIWYLCFQFTCFLACVVYFLFGITIGFITLSLLNIHLIIIDICRILNTLAILSLSSYYIMTIYIIIITMTQKYNQSFLILITLIYLSIAFGGMLKIDPFMPLNQGILSKHYISGFSFQWSYIFLCIMIFFNVIFLNRIIIERDLLEITH